MGTSNWQNISYSIDIIRKINPQTVLDIGIGFGRWGILMREFLEVWDAGIYDGKWLRRIDGVEIFPGYIRDYHNFFYTNIYLTSALEYLKKTELSYDLIHFGDVIEHHTKPEGEKLISLAMDKAKCVMINIPIGKHWAQEGTAENPNEEHKSIWYNNDFTKYRHHIIKSFDDLTKRNFSVVILSKKKIKFDNRYGKYFGIKNFLKHKLGLRKLIERYESRKK